MLGLGAGGACSGQGDNGAALVRWRITTTSKGDVTQSLCSFSDPPSFINVAIDQVELVADRLDAVAPTPPNDFPCVASEGTTGFIIPVGTYAFSLRALACGGTLPVGFVPPPQIRDVRAGEITNLNAIEILIPPCTAITCADAGNRMAACPQ